MLFNANRTAEQLRQLLRLNFAVDEDWSDDELLDRPDAPSLRRFAPRFTLHDASPNVVRLVGLLEGRLIAIVVSFIGQRFLGRELGKTIKAIEARNYDAAT